MKIQDIFNEPKIIGIVGTPNSAKSNLIYHFIRELKKAGKFNLFYFGLRNKINHNEIHSIKELEQIKNSVVILDEFSSLFDLDDRKQKRQIESSLRLIFHNNNILVLCGVPNNFKKFISGKLDIIIYKKLFYDDLVNGSKIKKVLSDYQDISGIKGSEVLNIPKNKALLYNGKYSLIENIPYLKEFDKKFNNLPIVELKGGKN